MIVTFNKILMFRSESTCTWICGPETNVDMRYAILGYWDMDDHKGITKHTAHG